jgi:streptogramin lyase
MIRRTVRGRSAKPWRRWARLTLEQLEDRSVPAILSEFPVPTAASGPTDIVLGADGNFWFTELNADRIGRITPAGVVTEFTLPVGRGLTGITSGPDGFSISRSRPPT